MIRIGLFPPTGGERHLYLFEFEHVNAGEARVVVIGYHRFGRERLAQWRAEGRRVRLSAVGVISFAPDVSPALVEDVFESIKVRGWVRNRPVRATSAPITP